MVSVLFSEPKIPQSRPADAAHQRGGTFQCSSASRKFLNSGENRSTAPIEQRVSVLFSEPKIPQSFRNTAPPSSRNCFSALQRAENSSMDFLPSAWTGVFRFQCSSASRKFLNASRAAASRHAHHGFSALQRAENSSIMNRSSSTTTSLQRFSALQRAENSSMPTLAPASIHISDRDDHASSFLSLPGASP